MTDRVADWLIVKANLSLNLNSGPVFFLVVHETESFETLPVANACVPIFFGFSAKKKKTRYERWLAWLWRLLLVAGTCFGIGIGIGIGCFLDLAIWHQADCHLFSFFLFSFYFVPEKSARQLPFVQLSQKSIFWQHPSTWIAGRCKIRTYLLIFHLSAMFHMDHINMSTVPFNELEYFVQAVYIIPNRTT